MRRPRSAPPASPATTSEWRDTIDRWVRDPAIRRHGLLALAMLLVAAAVAISLTMGALALAAAAVVPALPAKTGAIGLAGAAGAASLLWISRRRTCGRAATTRRTAARQRQARP